MNRLLYVISLGLGAFFISGCGSSGSGSSSSTPTCSIGAPVSGCSCPAGTTNVNNYCQSTGAYGGAYGSPYGSPYGGGVGAYGGCQPCANPYNGSQGIQTQYGCGTPIQQNNGMCTALLPNGQVVQGIPMQGYSGYPGGQQPGYPYGGGYIPPVYNPPQQYYYYQGGYYYSRRAR